MVRGLICMLYVGQNHVQLFMANIVYYCLYSCMLYVETDSGLCEAEVCTISGYEGDIVQWIKCDSCSRWIHKYCSGLLETANPRKFICDRHFWVPSIWYTLYQQNNHFTYIVALSLKYMLMTYPLIITNKFSNFSKLIIFELLFIQDACMHGL